MYERILGNLVKHLVYGPLGDVLIIPLLHAFADLPVVEVLTLQIKGPVQPGLVAYFLFSANFRKSSVT